MNAKHWGGPQIDSYIFVYMGDESSIVGAFNLCSYNLCGFMIEKAPDFHALLVYIEHRYYGLSMPLGVQRNPLAMPLHSLISLPHNHSLMKQH